MMCASFVSEATIASDSPDAEGLRDGHYAALFHRQFDSSNVRLRRYWIKSFFSPSDKFKFRHVL
jgi:hypothetical protein